jgi:hypothetical protein
MFEQEECIESLKDLRFPWIGRGLKRLVMLFVLVLINGGYLKYSCWFPVYFVARLLTIN